MIHWPPIEYFEQHHLEQNQIVYPLQAMGHGNVAANKTYFPLLSQLHLVIGHCTSYW